MFIYEGLKLKRVNTIRFIDPSRNMWPFNVGTYNIHTYSLKTKKNQIRDAKGVILRS